MAPKVAVAGDGDAAQKDGSQKRRPASDGPLGDTVLHEAARDGNVLACLRILAQPGFAEVNAQDSLSKTALHWAVSSGMSDVCFAILQRDDFTAVNVVDWRGQTAYDVAVAQNAPKELLD
eukprot:CAMPEP_0175466376 /NCGR_PEP_ID=MMETSP0095-20121207/70775_1 /TAXON_ID=311494 /ORGANISM="Alexandrium monilatum, Strain CCMP3105" /LENGTH=119 /DNA_ID=CAMNT_0016767721 /DNA_START=17 /DNA_END=373 /DNA_ORIENTATION=+